MKKAKKFNDLISYIKNEKNLKKEDISYLEYIGYLNLITPYKHFFHEGKSNGKHIYKKQVNISEYIKYYNDDLNQTLIIREVIYAYEKSVKSLINIY